MVSVLRVGTSGWHYKHWRGVFYPADLPPSEWFAYYAGTFRSWRESASPGFLFAVQASRYITHMKKLKDPEQPQSASWNRRSPFTTYRTPPASWQAFSVQPAQMLDQTYKNETRQESGFRSDHSSA